jgi:hypothetical protein
MLWSSVKVHCIQISNQVFNQGLLVSSVFPATISLLVEMYFYKTDDQCPYTKPNKTNHLKPSDAINSAILLCLFQTRT